MDLQTPRHRSPLQRAVRPQTTKPISRKALNNASRLVPLIQQLSRSTDQAAFKYLFRETSLDSIHRCLIKVRDQEISLYLQRGILQIASLMSSEAFTGIERVRRELRALRVKVTEDPLAARQEYDRHVETLGRYVFALGRRLNQIEVFFAGCNFSGSAEQMRGLYGQQVRDVAGDVLFLRSELARWVHRFVPIRGDLPGDEEGCSFLEGRIGAVVDDLGFRMKEIQEVVSTAIFNQLVIFDGSLTRGQLFKRDIENVLDVDHLAQWLSEMVTRVKRYDEGRCPTELERIKSLLRDFRPEQFPALAGIRESDHILFNRFVPRIIDYRHRPAGRGDDPIHVFLLLLGDLLLRLNRTGGA